MPVRQGPGGPYAAAPQPTPSPPVALYIPESARETATEEQLERIAQIELAFAHRVSVLLSETYSEVLAVLRSRLK